MSSLHVHGSVTPTSRVIKDRKTLKSPLSRSPIKKSPAPRPKEPPIPDHPIIGTAKVDADFRGLDVLSAIDYLKSLRHTFPQKCSREKRTGLLNQRRNIPDLVLAHQLTSLFPDMRDLEKEIHFLVQSGKIVEIPLQSGEMAYIRRTDYTCPEGLLDGELNGLDDVKVREYSTAGYLMRRNNELVLSAPNIGAYFSALRTARIWVCTNLRKAKGLALEKNMHARYELWTDGGIFSWESLMHDLVGSGRVEILLLTVGKALRLTKRGRELR